MGLDMYLTLRRQERGTVEIPEKIAKMRGAIGGGSLVTDHCETMYGVAYWRKANQVHQFFVDECADGVDECQRIFVGEEALEELADKCQKILLASISDKETKSVAEEELPPSEGFFFGTYEIDDYYIEQIQYTYNVCTELVNFLRSLSTKERWDYDVIYQASW